MALITDRMLDRLVETNPKKVNPSPWNPEKIIPCSDIVQKYKACKEANISDPVVKDECQRLKRFGYQCYQLDEKYFKEYVRSEMTEREYFDTYMQKIVNRMRVLPEKRVWEENRREDWDDE